MIRTLKPALLLGVAVLSLAACSSSKGPGEIGSKNDIVVRNNGLPQAKQAEAAPAAQGGDFSSTVEQAEAMPAPEVAAAEPLPDNSPAMKQAVAAQDAATAPLPSTPTSDATNSVVPADTETKPIDAVAPTSPVTDTTTPPPADAATPAVIPPTPESAPSATGAIYPSTDYPAAQTATPVPAPAAAPAVAATSSATPGPSAVPAGVKYPLDPNAPFSPKAVAAAAAAQGAIAATTPTPSSTGDVSNPATIKAAQAALKAKGGYAGAETGEIDAAFLNALIMYQSQNNLPQGGLNEATLRSLGVVQ